MAEEISKLKIGFSLDSSQLEKGMGHVLSNLNLMQKEFKSSMVGVDKFNKSLDDLGKEAEGLKGILNQQKIALAAIQSQYDKTTERQKENEAKVKELKKAYDEAVQSKSMDETALKELKAEYDKAVKVKNKDEKALRSLHAKYIDMTTQVKKSEMALEDVEKQIKENRFSYGKLNKSIGETSKNLRDLGGKLTGITKGFVGLTKVAVTTGTALATAVGALSVKQAIDVVDAQTSIANSLDITEQEAKQLGDTARKVWKEGFGSDMAEVSDAIIKVKQTLRQIKPDEIEDVAKKSLELTKITGADLQESLRGINALMVNFGLTSDEAFDYMVKGAKRGLNVSNEMEDNIAEYAQKWSEYGFSVQEMFAILENGLKSGAYNLDKVNDFVKEFGNSLNDGRIEDNIESFSKGTQNLFKQYKDGKATTKDVMNSVIADLEKMKDKQDKATLASTIWSALGEDNALKVIEALNDTNTAYKDVEGSMDDVIKRMEETPTAQFTKAWREFQDAFMPIGTALLEFGTEHMPQIREAVEKFAEKVKEIDWKELIDQGKELANKILPPLKKAFENVTEFIGKMDEDTIEMLLTIGGIGLVVGPAISALGLLGGALNLLRLGPVGLAIAAFGGLWAAISWIHKNWDAVKEWFSNLGKAVGDFAKKASKEFRKVFTSIDDFEAKMRLAEQKIVDDVVNEFGPEMKKAMDGVIIALKANEGGFWEIGMKLTQSLADGMKTFDPKSVARDIIGGIASAMKKDENLSPLKAASQVVGDRVTSFLKRSLDINSPSKVIAEEIGQWIPKGLAVGVTSNLDSVEKAAEQMALASIPNIPTAVIPQSSRNGIYGNQQNYHSNFSPTITINGSNNPYTLAQEQERLMRRMRFQGGIGRS